MEKQACQYALHDHGGDTVCPGHNNKCGRGCEAAHAQHSTAHARTWYLNPVPRLSRTAAASAARAYSCRLDACCCRRLRDVDKQPPADKGHTCGTFVALTPHHTFAGTGVALLSQLEMRHGEVLSKAQHS